MSSQYVTEPPATATVLLHTSAGSLTLSLFAQQTPLTCRNFLQHCLDGYYDNTLFHRVSPGFVIQAGDPTGTGEGGNHIYEDAEFERFDGDWAKLLRIADGEGEKITFGDEFHSRLRFNRRGLLGMAKGTGPGAGYGSQFFITLGDCRQQLDGQCTMFGRVEGPGIYDVVKIAEAELIEGTDRPMYPDKILRCEVVDMPKGEAWAKMRRRNRMAPRTLDTSGTRQKVVKKKGKGGKALLSFGDDDAGADVVVRPKKAKFNTNLIDGGGGGIEQHSVSKVHTAVTRTEQSPSPSSAPKRKAEPLAQEVSAVPKRRKPSFPAATTQLPLQDPEQPTRSPSPDTPPRRTEPAPKTAANLQAEIAALKASMKREVTASTGVDGRGEKKSALEALIPSTSTRGRRRPRPGEVNSKDDTTSLGILNAFRSRLENSAAALPKPLANASSSPQRHIQPSVSQEGDGAEADEEEAQLCDLHFIANCQSCLAEDVQDMDEHEADDREFLSHSLSFEKDRLGKDLNWKRKNEAELVVIDPREREQALGIKPNGRRKDAKRAWDTGRPVQSKAV